MAFVLLYDPEKVVGWYSKTKAMACQKVLQAVKSQDLNACIVHPAGIMGPNDYSNSTTTHTVLQILNGEMPIGMKGSFNMCDVRDLASACIAAVEKGRKGESYILGNEEVTLKQLFTYLSADVKCKPIKWYMPLWMANIMASIMEKRARRKGEKPVMTKFSVYNLARNNKYDYTKAQRELDYAPRPYQQTAKDEVQFLIKSGQFTPANN
jgi:dihydroflavonol-4-reductase